PPPPLPGVGRLPPPGAGDFGQWTALPGQDPSWPGRGWGGTGGLVLRAPQQLWASRRQPEDLKPQEPKKEEENKVSPPAHLPEPGTHCRRCQGQGERRKERQERESSPGAQWGAGEGSPPPDPGCLHTSPEGGKRSERGQVPAKARDQEGGTGETREREAERILPELREELPRVSGGWRWPGLAPQG
ncbi:hypothetical protein H1C71_007159, partial [Ictidomys tridecemlineatus]